MERSFPENDTPRTHAIQDSATGTTTPVSGSTARSPPRSSSAASSSTSCPSDSPRSAPTASSARPAGRSSCGLGDCSKSIRPPPSSPETASPAQTPPRIHHPSSAPARSATLGSSSRSRRFPESPRSPLGSEDHRELPHRHALNTARIVAVTSRRSTNTAPLHASTRRSSRTRPLQTNPPASLVGPIPPRCFPPSRALCEMTRSRRARADVSRSAATACLPVFLGLGYPGKKPLHCQSRCRAPDVIGGTPRARPRRPA